MRLVKPIEPLDRRACTILSRPTLQSGWCQLELVRNKAAQSDGQCAGADEEDVFGIHHGGFPSYEGTSSACVCAK